MRSHHGIAATKNLISTRFYWRTIDSDIKEYVKFCQQCQKVNAKLSSETPELKSVEVPKEVMRQIGIDISCLPESNGFKYIVVAIDYFTKWSEAKALTDKSAVNVARFLFEFICRHACIDIQINDQGREFVNQVSTELHRLTGVKQRISSAYHPQV
jgi:Integrase zinc binding domain/Integrase core domain